MVTDEMTKTQLFLEPSYLPAHFCSHSPRVPAWASHGPARSPPVLQSPTTLLDYACSVTRARNTRLQALPASVRLDACSRCSASMAPAAWALPGIGFPSFPVAAPGCRLPGNGCRQTRYTSRRQRRCFSWVLRRGRSEMPHLRFIMVTAIARSSFPRSQNRTS